MAFAAYTLIFGPRFILDDHDVRIFLSNAVFPVNNHPQHTHSMRVYEVVVCIA
jgi:hypothetical protein